MKFQAVLKLEGKTATGISIPDEVIEGLGAGKRPAVRCTINGYTFRSTVGTVNGLPMLGVNSDVREKAGVKAGDQLDVDIELDTEPREVEVPPELAALLDQDEAAKKFFEGLSRSNKRRLVEPLAAAKTDETRQRRLDKAMEMLREGRV